MPPNSQYKYGLNEKQCWDAWWECGTLSKASKLLYDQGITNYRGDGPISVYGLGLAAWRYACKNVEAAKDDFRKDYERRGVPFNDYEETEFYRRLLRAAKRIYVTPRTFDRFVDANGLSGYLHLV